MAAQIKNIIIFVVIATAFVLIYIFFIKKDQGQAGLVSSVDTTSATLPGGSPISAIDEDLLPLLLSVKNIKLDDTIFTDVAFSNLRDSSITLVPDGTEGRPNPFAPFGAEDKAGAQSGSTSSSGN